VCIFETHRKEEEVIDGERGFGLPGLRQTIVHLLSLEHDYSIFSGASEFFKTEFLVLVY